MTPSARLQAVADLVAGIQNSWKTGGPAADDLIAHYFRKRRYAGSKDRRNIAGRVYGMLRGYGLLKWRVEQAGFAATPRMLLITALMDEGVFDESAFGAGPYGLEILNEDEQGLIRALGESGAKPPVHARLNLPEWLVEPLAKQFGAAFEAEMQAMSGRAAFDIRVNSLKTGRGAVLARLKADGMTPGLTAYAPCGIRFEAPQPLSRHALFRAGHIEVQDESAQIAALLCDLRPGMQGVDLCAGAGGKTLALAAGMENKGQIYAYDPDKRRIGELKKRMQRAGTRNIQILEKPPRDTSRKLDRVVLDVPCSGTGTWRRNPELRQRLTRERLGETLELQRTLLAQGASLTAPKGRLIYMTCSILEAENEAQVDEFLDKNKGWRLLDYRQIFKDLGLSSIPESWSRNDHSLLLTPGRHGTDGFFTAVLEFSG